MEDRVFLTFAALPMMLRSSPRFRSPLFLVLIIPAVIKLLLIDPVRSFEVHDMALEWIGSGEFRQHHLGAWNYTFQFPVYTAIVALFYLIGLGKTTVLVFQVLCGTASAYLIHRTALVVLSGRSYARSVAITVTALTGLSPFLAYYQVRVLHPFAWDMFLALALFHASWTTRTDRPKQLIGLFLLAGLALFDRPTLAVCMLPFLWHERHYLFGLSAVWLKLFLLILMFVPLGLWSLRNHAVTGRYELNSVTDQMVWMGMQEETEGSGQLPSGDTYVHLLTTAEGAYLVTLDPAGQSAFFRRKWREELRARPWTCVKMLVVKLKNFWLFRSHMGLDHSIKGVAWAVLFFKIYAVLVFLLVLGVPLAHNTKLRTVLMTVLCLSLAQSIFYFETRHRLLVEPLIMLIAVVVIAELSARCRVGRYPTMGSTEAR